MHKLAVEIDDKGQKNRDTHKEIESQEALEKGIDCNLLELILTKKIVMNMLNLVK